MTPSARIQATLEILQAIEDTPRPADALIGAYFRSRRFIGSKDRHAISTRLYGVLRHRARLTWWLTRASLPSTPRLRLLAWLALGESLKRPLVDDLCRGGPYAPVALDKTEQSLLHVIEGCTIEHPDMPDEVIAECPPRWAASLKEKFGQHFMHEMRAMQEPATLDLRINPLKTTREDIMRALKELGFRAELCPLSPWGVRVFERPSLHTLDMLKNGLVEIQDEGSQMIAFIVDAKPGERVVDFCAGAGGKTLAIAATMENKGRVIACDVMEKRLKRSTDRFRRAGLHNIEIRALSSERDSWVKKHKNSFDRVLTDAPCTGTGTWRRNPDARWRNLGPSLEDLVKTQGDILESAARLVKEGGRLIYATCSLLREENESQIEKFIETHPQFTLLPCGLKSANYLSLSPARHQTDGFFAAVMVKSLATKE